jgi:3-oxoacyl-[acyl-carrier protein] reductase
MLLLDKVSIVTGAAAGIGVGIAELFAQQGAIVYLIDIDGDACEAAAQRINAAGGQAYPHTGDVSKVDSIIGAVQTAASRHGRIDILVNNAGIYEFAPLEEVTPEHFHKQFDLNVLGLLLASQEAVKHFGPSGGSIINISSVAATAAPATTSVYSATKAAVDAVTKALAKELGPRNIRVNAINPGMVETEGTHSAGIAENEMRKQLEALTPLGRIGQPQDIAAAAVFLASSDSSWITGETFVISGGYR